MYELVAGDIVKKIFVILTIFNIFSVQLFSNEKRTVYENQLVEKKGMVYCKGDSMPFTGRVISNKNRNYYLNGKPNGKWLTFYANGNLKSIENWKNGKLYGKYVLYQKNGIKIFETKYFNGKDDGIYILYHENGVIQVQGRFSKGIPKGTWKYYNSKGKLIGKAVYPEE